MQNEYVWRGVWSKIKNNLAKHIYIYFWLLQLFYLRKHVRKTEQSDRAHNLVKLCSAILERANVNQISLNFV